MPYKKVVAIGDSFTRGDELADCPDQIPGQPYQPLQSSNSTWPALVAQNLSIDYECIAFGGRGNHRISYQVSKELQDKDLHNCLIIVNWSYFERFDYFDLEADNWATTHPRNDNRLNHYFYKHIDSEIWNLHRNIQQIHSTITLLDSNKIEFIMTCIDPMLYMKHKDVTPLQEQILHRIVNFYGYTFLEWANHKKFPIGPGGHPLEKAHVEAAKYINMVTTEGKINGH
tara:strand:+ start:1446 stop:2129 length:684 start_codon:yes stop_codon:yes gene_type:complete